MLQPTSWYRRLPCRPVDVLLQQFRERRRETSTADAQRLRVLGVLIEVYLRAYGVETIDLRAESRGPVVRGVASIELVVHLLSELEEDPLRDAYDGGLSLRRAACTEACSFARWLQAQRLHGWRLYAVGA